MSELRLNIDGREVVGFDGQTILQIARENGIDIPTLCHNERVKMYGSCGVCVVEAKSNPKLLRSCSTYAVDGMIIKTDTERVLASRKTALELLLSDHTGDCRPPCALACPAETDCQGYVGLIANGEYHEALKLVKDSIPLPASIGRVCPHPCEEACRRKLVEEPISIAALKRFVGDLDLESGKPLYTAEAGKSTGKRVAVIGGGPGGLSAAYFLRISGHAVTIYDAMPEMGGMLRYGIPEYRLSKKLLGDECGAIENMGVEFRNNIKIGRDISIDYLRNSYDAVIVAVGAWKSSALRCPGENLKGVIGGIDFLREVALGNSVFIGNKVAVVGGGNTAMDCARTAVRLGAEKVYNVYRRTKNEMPAEEIEIIEAEEEGVIFKNLTNPIEALGKDGRVAALRLQIMELGQPDASGRRAPVPVEGSEEAIEVDTVIVAIGQQLDATGIETIEQTKWRTIAADEKTFRTNLPGVFAIGDATNNGADIAISAIGEAKKAAAMVDLYLKGETLNYDAPYLVHSEKTEKDFEEKEKQCRIPIKTRPASVRKKDFIEITDRYSIDEAKREAARCLECGCYDYFECKLIEYANRYKVKPDKYDGKAHHRETMKEHSFIHRNSDKCILCGLCVRICSEVVGATALGLVNRGFDAVVSPALGMALAETDCISCGQCVSVCPTGALTETMMIPKQTPLRENVTKTTCSFCSVGCSQKLTSKGNMLIRSLPVAEKEKDALLCINGRFGFGEISRRDRVTVPMINGKESSYEQAYVLTNKRLQALQSHYGYDCIGVAVSDRLTNEEAFLIKEYAEKTLKTKNLFCFNRLESGIAETLGRDASTATFDEMMNTELIIVVAADLIKRHAVAGMKIRQAVESGAKLLLLTDGENPLDDISTLHCDIGADLSFLKNIAKALLNDGKNNNMAGFNELSAYLCDSKVNEVATSAAEMIRTTGNAVFVFERNAISVDAAKLVADIALLSGHAFGPRNGVIQILPGANTQGLANLGIDCGNRYRRMISDGEIKGLFIFGEDVSTIGLESLEFLAVQDLHITDTAKAANVIFPASSFAEIHGSFTSADGKVQAVCPVVDSVIERDSFTQLVELSEQYSEKNLYKSTADITKKLTSKKEGEANPFKLSVPIENNLLRDDYTDSNALRAYDLG